jgi:hypothetical protein
MRFCPTESIRANAFWAVDRIGVDFGDKRVSRSPGFLRRFTDDYMQSDAMRECASISGRCSLSERKLLGNGGGRLAPGQVDVNMLGRDFTAGRGRPAEIERRIRGLEQRIQKLAPFDLKVGVRLGHFLALHQLAPD